MPYPMVRDLSASSVEIQEEASNISVYPLEEVSILGDELAVSEDECDLVIVERLNKVRVSPRSGLGLTPSSQKGAQ